MGFCAFFLHQIWNDVFKPVWVVLKLITNAKLISLVLSQFKTALNEIKLGFNAFRIILEWNWFKQLDQSEFTLV